MEQPGVVAANLGLRFSPHFLSIFVHISGSIRPISLIWALLERSSSPSEVECRWCQFWSKVMTSEVEERPRVVMALYGGLGVNGLSGTFCLDSFSCKCQRKGEIYFFERTFYYPGTQLHQSSSWKPFWIALIRDDAQTFFVTSSRGLVAIRLRVVSWRLGKILSCSCQFFSFFCPKCLNDVLPTAVQTLQTWKSKSPGIAYHWRTKNCFLNGSQKFHERTRQLMSTRGYVATTLKSIALKKIPGSSRVNLKQGPIPTRFCLCKKRHRGTFQQSERKSVEGKRPLSY